MGEFSMEYKTHAPVNPFEAQKIKDEYERMNKNDDKF
jgi:hypothetical protein